MERNLNGNWKVTHLPFGADIASLLEDHFVPEGWLEAQVPEEIHATLRRAGVLRGNTYGKPAEEETWTEECDWIYYKEFYMPEEPPQNRVFLEFQGIDTFCEIYLNGTKIAEHKNMFTPCRTEVKNKLRFGTRNVLLVRILSAVQAVKGMDDSKIFSITDSDRIFARKAQMNYGWDFCGRCVTAGIWKPVCLYSEKPAGISSYYLYTEELCQGTARLGLNVCCEFSLGENPQDYGVRAVLSCHGAPVLSWEGSVPEAAQRKFVLEDPKLWWPCPYGEAFLYDFTLSLLRGGDCVQELRQKFGVRTIQVLQERQPDGLSFQFSVNGKKLFLRGANWVPINTVYTDISEQDYEAYLDAAVEGNLSMPRVWGGGIYEPLSFFDLCAERGILVWSDFMLACGIYPQDPEFLDLIREEGEFVVRAYRNCTALALWSGDNENGQAYGWAGRPYEFRQDGITRRVLREICSRLDPSRFYLATSPDSPQEEIKGGDQPNSPYQGDSHLYLMAANPGVRGGRDYGADYYKRILGYHPRFVSEFGFPGCPDKDTFFRYNFRREALISTQEMERLYPFAARCFQEGRTEEGIYFTQLFQASALKYWIEYFRSLKGICSGCLYWKFNDPLADRPVVGIFPSHMSTVDMYGNRKMAFDFTRRAYENVILTAIETDLGWKLFACNELDREFSGTLTLSLQSFSGKLRNSKTFACVIPPDSAAVLCTISKEEFAPGNRFAEYLLARFSGSGLSCENRWFFTDIFEIHQLELPKSDLKATAFRKRGNTFSLLLQTRFFARSIRLNIFGRRVSFSDNYFDLDPGSRKEIRITLKDEADWESAALSIDGRNVQRQVFPLTGFPSED